MKRWIVAIAAAAALITLVLIAFAVIAVTTTVGALAAHNALGNAAMHLGARGLQLPPELAGLGDLPAAERFAHFVGVQVSLKDKDNRPFTVTVIPGTVGTVTASDLTIAANDGSSRTFTLDSRTIMPVKSGRARFQTLQSGDRVIVVTANGDQRAMAIISAGNGDFEHDHFGGPPWDHWGHFGPQR